MTRTVGRQPKGWWASLRVTVSLGVPSPPQVRHQGFGVVTWQRISAFAAPRYCPIAVSPKPSSPVKVVRSGSVKVELSNVEVFQECLCGNFHSSGRPRLFRVLATCPGSRVLVLGGYTLNPEEPVIPVANKGELLAEGA